MTTYAERSQDVALRSSPLVCTLVSIHDYGVQCPLSLNIYFPAISDGIHQISRELTLRRDSQHQLAALRGP